MEDAKKVGLAIAELERSIATAPKANLQKLWKNLGDLHEKAGNWLQHIECLQKLFEYVEEKENYTRMASLVDEINSKSWASRNISLGLQFLVEYVTKYGSRDPVHTCSLLASIHRFQLELDTQDQRVYSQRLSSLGSGDKKRDLLAREAFRNPSSVFQLALEVCLTPEVEAARPTADLEAISQLLVRYLSLSRASMDILIMSTEELAVEWKVLLDESLLVCNLPAHALTKPDLIQAVGYLAESWAFVIPSDDAILLEIDNNMKKAIAVDPLNLATNLYLMQQCISQCKFQSGRKFLAPLVNAIKATAAVDSIFSKTVSFPLSATSSVVQRNVLLLSDGSLSLWMPQEISLATLAIAAVVIHESYQYSGQGATHEELLSWSEETLRRLNILNQLFGRIPLGNDLIDGVKICRVRSLQQVGQLLAAGRSACALLPSIFATPAATAPPGPSDSIVIRKVILTEEFAVPYKCNEEIVTTRSREVSAQHPSTNLLHVLLIRTQIHFGIFPGALAAINDALGDPQSPIKSLLLLLRGEAMLFEAASQNATTALLASGWSRSPVVCSFLELQLDESLATNIIRVFQAAIKVSDELSLELAAELNIKIGLCMWLSGGRLRKDKNGCIAFLLNGARIDANHPRAFAYIGHYYFKELSDFDRSRKCYEKILAVDPQNQEAGFGFSEVLVAAGKLEAGEEFLSLLSKTSGHARWCFVTKGRLHLSRKEWENAVVYFQRAVELNEEESWSWSSLGNAYFKLEQYSAARKCFLKTVEISPEDSIALSQLGDVELKLGLFSDSFTHYSKSLQCSRGTSIVALRGIGDVSLTQAYQFATVGWVAGAARTIVRGVKTIRGTLESRDVGKEGALTLFNLLGDLSAFACHIGPFELASAMTGNTTMSLSTESTFDLVDRNIRSWYSSGTAAYLAVVSLLLREFDVGRNIEHREKYLSASESAIDDWLDETFRGLQSLTTNQIQSQFLPTLANAVFNLGCLLFSFSGSLLALSGQGSGLVGTNDIINSNASVKKYLNLSRQAFAVGTRLDPLNGRCWNGLGLSSIGTDELVRIRCLARAAEVENTPNAYGNLGSLLLQRQHLTAAENCLSEQQLLENNPLTWSLFGKIIELRAHGSHDLSSAMDAYVAALEIAKPSEAIIGAVMCWMRLQGYVKPTGEFADLDFGNAYDIDLNNLRHDVEIQLRIFLRRYPVHPLAWLLLAWSLCARKWFAEANAACLEGFAALERISLAQPTGPLRNAAEQLRNLYSIISGACLKSSSPSSANSAVLLKALGHANVAPEDDLSELLTNWSASLDAHKAFETEKILSRIANQSRNCCHDAKEVLTGFCCKIVDNASDGKETIISTNVVAMMLLVQCCELFDVDPKVQVSFLEVACNCHKRTFIFWVKQMELLCGHKENANVLSAIVQQSYELSKDWISQPYSFDEQEKDSNTSSSETRARRVMENYYHPPFALASALRHQASLEATNESEGWHNDYRRAVLWNPVLLHVP